MFRKHIPENHLLRHINQFLDFDQIREHLVYFYSHIGRPSIDSELMIRMLLVGYCYGIRSERRLCEEVNFNLAYRWFCGLGLEDSIPNHSSFSKNRHGRFRDADIFRGVFNNVVQQCIKQGLVKGEGFAIDASFIRADVSRQRGTDKPIDWGPSKYQNLAVKEYLEGLDEVPRYNRPQKIISLTDPMSQWSAAKGPAEFYYSTNYLIDVEFGVVMDVEGSPSTLSLEVATTQTMIERVERNHGIVPERLMGDSAYGAAANLDYLVEKKGIEPHIPIVDKSKRSDGTFTTNDFIWVEELNEYQCPKGKSLKHGRRKLRSPDGVTKENTKIYRASTSDCKACPIKNKCCPNAGSRKITRSIYETSREVAKAIVESPAYLK